MTRGLIAAAILGLTAIPCTAGDNYVPYAGCGSANLNGNYATSVGSCGPDCSANRGECKACGGRGDSHDRLRKFVDFLCYKPTIPCDPQPRCSVYTPPLTAWFPCTQHLNWRSGCGCRDGAKVGFMGHRVGPCGSCSSCAANQGPAALGAPTVQQPLPRMPAASPYGMLTRPVPNVDSTIVQQSYTVTKPAKSNQIQTPEFPARPPSYLHTGFVPQLSRYLPR